MSKKYGIRWGKAGNADYLAALSYLKLLYREAVARAYVKKLKRAAQLEFQAKDIFRVSGLSLLGERQCPSPERPEENQNW